MKVCIYSLFLLMSYSVNAQKTEVFYNYYWQPSSAENASYFSTVEKKDSGWLRNDYYISTKKLQMQALYKDKDCKVQNGNYIYYYSNGYVSSVGKMVSGKQEGICIRYHSNGVIADSALFQDGKIADKLIRWHRNGFMADSISKVNDSMYSDIGWFDDGNLSHAGYLKGTNKVGKWKYYHHNGQLSCVEIFNIGTIRNTVYFNESGITLTDTSSVNQEAQFIGGEETWKKYLSKHLYWPSELQFNTSASVTIGVNFTVDENGKVTDAEVSLPFHKEFDKIALNIIKSSPAWKPATSYNRKVKAYRKQPVTFVQPD